MRSKPSWSCAYSCHRGSFWHMPRRCKIHRWTYALSFTVGTCHSDCHQTMSKAIRHSVEVWSFLFHFAFRSKLSTTFLCLLTCSQNLCYNRENLLNIEAYKVTMLTLADVICLCQKTANPAFSPRGPCSSGAVVLDSIRGLANEVKEFMTIEVHT